MIVNCCCAVVQIKHLSRALRELQDKVDKYEAILQANLDNLTSSPISLNNTSEFLSPVKCCEESFTAVGDDHPLDQLSFSSSVATTTDNSTEGCDLHVEAHCEGAFVLV